MNLNFLFNHSANSSTTLVSPRGIVLVVVESFIFLILNITAFVGNLLLCMAFYRNPSLRTVTNNFILSLALTDLLIAVFVMPVYTASSLANRWIAGDIGLTLVLYIRHVAGGVSLLTVMLVSINRYFRVVRPELYRKMYSKKSSLVMVAASWIVTTLLAFTVFPSPGTNYGNNVINPTSPDVALPNTMAFIYYIIILNLYIIVPSVAVAICYVKIYQTIRQHNVAAAPSSQEGNSSYGVEEARMTRLLTVVVVGFYICWIPFIVTQILHVSKLITQTKYLSFYKEFPVFASSVVNPLVYGAVNAPFRSEILKIIRR